MVVSDVTDSQRLDTTVASDVTDLQPALAEAGDEGAAQRDHLVGKYLIIQPLIQLLIQLSI